MNTECQRKVSISEKAYAASFELHGPRPIKHALVVDIDRQRPLAELPMWLDDDVVGIPIRVLTLEALIHVPLHDGEVVLLRPTAKILVTPGLEEFPCTRHVLASKQEVDVPWLADMTPAMQLPTQ